MDAPDDDGQHLKVDGDASDTATSSESGGGCTESESGSEVENDSGRKRVKAIKILLKKTLKRIREEDSKDKKSGQSQFNISEKDYDILASETGNLREPTALHIMASKGKTYIPKSNRSQMLIAQLVGPKNDILRIQDKWKQTAIHLAIETKNERMVQWMCAAHKEIGSIIAITDREKDNCVHFGIKKKIKVNFLSLLVDNADAEVLVARNGHGNTPLHLAVEYYQCKKGQLGIIKKIVAKTDRLFQERNLSDFNNDERSPFHLLKEKMEKAREQGLWQEAEEGLKEYSKPEDNGALDEYKVQLRPAAKEETTAPGRRPSELPSSPRPQKRRKRNAQTPAPTGESITPSQAGWQPLEALEEEEKQSQQAESGKASDAEAAAAASHLEVDDTLRSLERFLKLHYLRSRSHPVALKILYGSNPELELNFDLSGYDSITRMQLENLLSKLMFEEILQYIAIPKLNLETDVFEVNGTRSRRTSRVKQDGSGRQDLCYIFDCLRQKGVGTIIKVIVNEMDSSWHSDDAIEKALKDFNVEIWDWRRADLCSEVIRRAAPKVREVHLYWSGNNAVLRGWGDEGGLKMLEELRDVHLHIQQGLETRGRTNKDVEDFCNGMKKRCPNITISTEWQKAQRPSTETARAFPLEQEGYVTKHEWIQCMRDFSHLVIDAVRSCEGHRDDDQLIEEPIKVALIDDGVDFKDLENYHSIKGLTFCTRDEEHNLNAPYYVSSTGHGTIMARFIHMLCPQTEFYVLRLDDQISEDGNRQITAKSAVKAIHAAIEKKVHIISMSWTIDPPEDQKDRSDLDKAVADAAAAGILMFCSASDKGAKTGQTYPAMAKPNKIFKIGAATAAGLADKWTGDIAKLDFTFPGAKVELDGYLSKQGTPSAASGSSVATALAAGLAALVLFCAQVRILVADKDKKSKARKDFQNLKEHDHMMTVLKGIGTTAESGGKYITVWNSFGKSLYEEKKGLYDPASWIKMVADVGTNLCGKMVQKI